MVRNKKLNTFPCNLLPRLNFTHSSPAPLSPHPKRHRRMGNGGSIWSVAAPFCCCFLFTLFTCSSLEPSCLWRTLWWVCQVRLKLAVSSTGQPHRGSVSQRPHKDCSLPSPSSPWVAAPHRPFQRLLSIRSHCLYAMPGTL